MMPPDESWSECPAGEFAELQRSLKEQERRIRNRRRLLLAAGSVSLGIASGAIGIALNRQNAPVSILSCQETIDLLPKYVDGTLIDTPMQQAVQKHLEHCQQCREYFDKTY